MIIYNEDNSVNCYQGIIRDISERKRAEEALSDKSDKIDVAKALADLAQASAQIKMIESLRKNRK